ncbi:unnamed protein product, partial [Cyprideis torosa]
MRFPRENKQESTPLTEKRPSLVYQPPQVDQAGKGTKPESIHSDSAPTGSFYLQPAAGELLKQLEEGNYEEFRHKQERLQGLKIMWPAYFFSLQKQEGEMATLLFDAAENGFGPTLLAEVDVTAYPQALELEGPGGQNVNKVSSAAQLRFDVKASSLPLEVKERLLTLRDSRISKEG